MVTDCALVYVPAAGLKVGVGTCGMFIVYVALATLLLVKPASRPMALSVMVCETLIAPVYGVDEAVGALPGTPLPEALKQLLASDQAVYQVSGQHQAFMQLVRAPLTPAAVGMVLALVVGLGGMFVATTIWFLGRAPLAPVRDPRLPESLNFENT